MLNINFGHNLELMEKCRRLKEYALFVETVRKYAADGTLKLSTAISLAIEECIQNSILSDILTDQRAEVYSMILETFDRELYEKDLIANAKEEFLEEIRDTLLQEGETRKLIELICKKRSKGYSIEEISDSLEENPAIIQELIQKYNL